jgi:hypothetical protein
MRRSFALYVGRKRREIKQIRVRDGGRGKV